MFTTKSGRNDHLDLYHQAYRRHSLADNTPVIFQVVVNLNLLNRQDLASQSDVTDKALGNVHSSLRPQSALETIPLGGVYDIKATETQNTVSTSPSPRYPACLSPDYDAPPMCVDEDVEDDGNPPMDSKYPHLLGDNDVIVIHDDEEEKGFITQGDIIHCAHDDDIDVAEWTM